MTDREYEQLLQRLKIEFYKEKGDIADLLNSQIKRQKINLTNDEYEKLVQRLKIDYYKEKERLRFKRQKAQAEENLEGIGAFIGILGDWIDFARYDSPRMAGFVMAFIIFVLSCMIGFLPRNNLTIIILLIFLLFLVFVIPILAIKAFDWLKGMGFMLLCWAVSLFSFFTIDYFYFNSTEQEIQQNSQKSMNLSQIQLFTQDEFVNLRKVPNGEIIAKIYKKDFDKISLKKLKSNDKKWLKVLYFPPNTKDESKAITGFIHTSQIKEVR